MPPERSDECIHATRMGYLHIFFKISKSDNIVKKHKINVQKRMPEPTESDITFKSFERGSLLDHGIQVKKVHSFVPGCT